MKLTRTPGSRRVHDYSLALTKDELIGMSHYGSIGGQLILINELFNLIDREAERLGAGEE